MLKITDELINTTCWATCFTGEGHALCCQSKYPSLFVDTLKALSDLWFDHILRGVFGAQLDAAPAQRKNMDQMSNTVCITVQLLNSQYQLNLSIREMLECFSEACWLLIPCPAGCGWRAGRWGGGIVLPFGWSFCSYYCMMLPLCGTLRQVLMGFFDASLSRLVLCEMRDSSSHYGVLLLANLLAGEPIGWVDWRATWVSKVVMTAVSTIKSGFAS